MFPAFSPPAVLPTTPRTLPPATCPRMSIADDMCAALAARYGHDGVPRVAQSVRDVASGNALETGAGTPQHRRATSHVAGLASRPFWETSDLAWGARLEAAAGRIRDDLSARSAAGLAAGTNVWAGPARPEATAYGPDWRTLVLQDREWDPVNCGLFAETAAVLRDEGELPSVEAFFARQKPDSGIALHTDDCNFILTAHLALDVPRGESWIEVGGERRYWEDGRLLTFDTSYFHRTMNESQVKDRTVLLLRFWHPELDQQERDALAFVFRAIEDPVLLDSPLDAPDTAAQPPPPPPPRQQQVRPGVPREKRRAMRKGGRKRSDGPPARGFG